MTLTGSRLQAANFDSEIKPQKSRKLCLLEITTKSEKPTGSEPRLKIKSTGGIKTNSPDSDGIFTTSPQNCQHTNSSSLSTLTFKL